jgi:hypothetical protein
VTTQLVQLPFPGFYDNRLTHALDQELEDWVERLVQEYDHCSDRLVAAQQDGTLLEAMNDATHWPTVFQTLAKAYCETFIACFPKVSMGMAFESMREYNFTTDRLFATVPLSTVTAWWDALQSAPDILETLIAERHTSRSGFHSWYSNDPDVWRAKPLAEWDHNECTTLLLARLRQLGYTEHQIEAAVDEGLCVNGDFDRALWAGLPDDRRDAILARFTGGEVVDVVE